MNVPRLPPGDYKVLFELSGMAPIQNQATIVRSAGRRGGWDDGGPALSDVVSVSAHTANVWPHHRHAHLTWPN